MSNTLLTILDDSSNYAMVEEYLEKKLLEQTTFEGILANNKVCQTFTIPERSGQYVKCMRRNHFRLPENIDNSNRLRDPKSGAGMGYTAVRFPLEGIHEYVPIGKFAMWTSWDDLDDFAMNELPLAIKRAFHRRMQAAARVGRYQPGVWGTDGTAETAFETTVETSVTIDDVPHTFLSLPSYFTGGKTNFLNLTGSDVHRMNDYLKAKVRLANGNVPKNGRYYDAFISEAIQADLMRDDEYFAANIRAFKGEGLKEGVIAEYKGIRWHIDDEPFTEGIGAPNVRAVAGQIHTGIVVGRGALAYTKLGGKTNLMPEFKVQDISKTGKEKTIGYTIPGQWAVATREYGCCVVGAVNEWEANG